MSQEATTNQDAPKNLKPSDEVIKEIAGTVAEPETSIIGRAAAKSEEDFLLRLKRLEKYAGFGTAVADTLSERDEDEKRQLQLVKQQELRKLVAEADKMVQDNEGRRKFSWAIFWVMVLWILIVLLVVILCANGWWHLSDSVLIALITTTTATVIGVFVVVANYLFNRDKST